MTVLRKALTLQADVYHLHDPELIPLGLVLARLFGKRVVYDAEEDFPSMMQTKAWIPTVLRTSATRITEASESLAARYFEGVITADPSTLRRMTRTGRSQKLVFFNLPALELFPEPIHENKRFDFVYRGGLSDRCGTLLLLHALRSVIDAGNEASLLLVGYFENLVSEQAVRQQISLLKLEEWVQVESGKIPHELMAEKLSVGRVGVCPLLSIPKFRHNIPVKIFEYWACALPVIASDLPPIVPFFRQEKFGLLFRPGDVKSLASAMLWMLRHPAEAHQMGSLGRNAVRDRLNNRCESQKLRRFYERIMMGGLVSEHANNKEPSLSLHLAN